MFNIFKPAFETAVIFISEKLVINGFISNQEEEICIYKNMYKWNANFNLDMRLKINVAKKNYQKD